MITIFMFHVFMFVAFSIRKIEGENGCIFLSWMWSFFSVKCFCSWYNGAENYYARIVSFGMEDFQARFENLEPLQFIDVLALMGDKVDNIPGALQTQIECLKTINFLDKSVLKYGYRKRKIHKCTWILNWSQIAESITLYFATARWECEYALYLTSIRSASQLYCRFLISM